MIDIEFRRSVNHAMIDKVEALSPDTPDFRALFDLARNGDPKSDAQIAAEYKCYGIDTTPSDRAAVEAAVPAMIQQWIDDPKLPTWTGVPPMFWCASPREAACRVLLRCLAEDGNDPYGNPLPDSIKKMHLPAWDSPVLQLPADDTALWSEIRKMGRFMFLSHWDLSAPAGVVRALRNNDKKKLEETKPLYPIIPFVEPGVHWWYAFDTQIFLIEKPVAMSYSPSASNGWGGLVNDDGPTMEWSDGFGIYHLGGISLDADHRWLVQTPRADLDPAAVLGVRNAQLRMHAIRRMGLHRLLDQPGVRVLDEATLFGGHPYRLVDLSSVIARALDRDDFNRRRSASTDPMPYLVMTNPSTGEIHVEGVPSDIKTCQAAHAWRARVDDWQPEELA